jgi:predicted 3-demethylubiquinone-9 3-methyltransferase (glyoxalase superfamily)
VPEAEQCGWLMDKFGLSWQIVPETMSELLSTATPEEAQRITEAFLGMKRLDIRALEQAKRG